MDRPIPAFYCVYLLRSAKPLALPYVGSTPHPYRRLKQHNGDSKGGARRTATFGSRPWTMALVVTGFPSKIAALQFEWAWQFSYKSRHIPEAERIPQHHHSETPRVGRKPSKPRATLHHRLKSLHLLLRAKSFARWPLEVRFYNQDTWKKWQKWTEQTPAALPEGRSIFFDNQSANDHVADDGLQLRLPGIEASDLDYSKMKPTLHKSVALLSGSQPVKCTVCNATMKSQQNLILVCQLPDCHMTAHLTCLSNHFLSAENRNDAIVPVRGTCPDCKSELSWMDLLRDLTLRIRGKETLKKLMKVPREKIKDGETAEPLTLTDAEHPKQIAGTGVQPLSILKHNRSILSHDADVSSCAETDDGSIEYREPDIGSEGFADIDEVVPTSIEEVREADICEPAVSPRLLHRECRVVQHENLSSPKVIPDSDSGWDEIDSILT